MDGGGWTLLTKAKYQAKDKLSIQYGSWQEYTSSGIGHPDDSESDVFWAPLSTWRAFTLAFPKNTFTMIDSSHRSPSESASQIVDMRLTAED